MKTGHLNRPKTDETIYAIHKKIIAIDNSENAPIYFIFRISSNSSLLKQTDSQTLRFLLLSPLVIQRLNSGFH